MKNPPALPGDHYYLEVSTKFIALIVYLWYKFNRYAVQASLLNSFYVVVFGEALELARAKMNQKNVYLTNPAFDRK